MLSIRASVVFPDFGWPVNQMIIGWVNYAGETWSNRTAEYPQRIGFLWEGRGRQGPVLSHHCLR